MGSIHRTFFPILCALCCGLQPLHAERDSHSVTAPLKIGLFLCLSGNCADWGVAALRGAQLAAQELNQSGGVLGHSIELVVEDTRESISGVQALQAFKNLTETQALRLLIGPSWSPGGLSVAPVASRRSDILLITPSVSAEEFSRAGANLFNIRPSERFVTQSLAQYLVARGLKRAAVISSSQAAEATQGKIFQDAFRENGGTILKLVETNPEQSDIRTEVLQALAAKPEVLFVITYNQMASAARVIRTQHFPGSVATISIDDNRVAAAEGLLEDWLVARAPAPSAEFRTAFQTRFSELPGLSAENGYDALYAIAKAAAAANSLEPTHLAETLKKIHFRGAAGEIAFSDSRFVEQVPQLYHVRNGKLVSLDTH